MEQIYFVIYYYKATSAALPSHILACRKQYWLSGKKLKGPLRFQPLRIWS